MQVGSKQVFIAREYAVELSRVSRGLNDEWRYLARFYRLYDGVSWSDLIDIREELGGMVLISDIGDMYCDVYCTWIREAVEVMRKFDSGWRELETGSKWVVIG